MIERIAPQFFSADMEVTLAYYAEKLGFECCGTWGEPPDYAIVERDGHAIHFRFAESSIPHPDKYDDELLDAYIAVDNGDSLYEEYRTRGVTFSRELGNKPWGAREFVVKDCDGRLLAFGGPVDG